MVADMMVADMTVADMVVADMTVADRAGADRVVLLVGKFVVLEADMIAVVVDDQKYSVQEKEQQAEVYCMAAIS